MSGDHVRSARKMTAPPRGFWPRSLSSCGQGDRGPDQRTGRLLKFGRSAHDHHTAVLVEHGGGVRTGGAGMGAHRGARPDRSRDRQRRHRRRRHRPERARGRRLGDRGNAAICRRASSRSSSPTIRAATCCPICRRPTTTSGCAATAWSIRRRSKSEPGKQLNLTAVPAPNEAAAAQYYPAIYWYSMMKIPADGSVRRQERHPGQRSSRPTGST